MSTAFFKLGCIAGLLAVVLGAFAAHGLQSKIAAESIKVFETGVRYQFYHAFALIIVGLLFEKQAINSLNWAGISFAVGILLFSGSLYFLSTQDWTGLSLRWLGPITPLGGLFFIIGWGSLLLAAFRSAQ